MGLKKRVHATKGERGLKIGLRDEEFEKMVKSLREGENRFTFTDEDGVFEETFELRRIGERKVKNVDTGEVYDSVAVAAREVHLSRSYLSSYLNSSRQSSIKGVKLQWEFGVHAEHEWLRHQRWKRGRSGY